MGKTKLIQRIQKLKKFIGPEVVRLFYLAIAAGIFLFAVESSFVWCLQSFLLVLGVSPRESLHMPEWYPRSLSGVVCILVIAGFLRAGCYFFKTYLEGVVCQAFYRFQREKVVAYSLEYAAEISTHEAIAIFTDGINHAGGALQNILALLITSTATLFFFFLGFRIAPIEMLVGVSALLLIAVVFRKVDRKIKSSGEGLLKEWTAVSERLLNGIRHNFFFRVYGLIGSEKKKAFSNLSKYQIHHRRYQAGLSLKIAAPQFLGICIVSSITFLSLRYFHTQGAVLFSFFYIFTRMIQSASEIVTGAGNLRFNLPHVRLVYQWHQRLEKKIELSADILASRSGSKKEILDLLEKKGVSIELDNICFGYGDRLLFKDFSLKLGRGDCLVISGESGSGKSSLLALLLGVQKPLAGKIKVYGEDISQIRDELFGLLGYIGPEPYLITGTVKENLLFGHPNPSVVDREKISRALKLAQAEEFVSALPNQENTFLNEVARLSTGQKQRLSIARALLRSPKLLIMDECTSNLDLNSEKEIVNGLTEILPEMTTIVVTHRPVFQKIATKYLSLDPLSKNKVEDENNSAQASPEVH